MVVVAVDWCKGGWFALRIEGNYQGAANAAVFPNARSLLDARGDASLFLIDIPIGLPDAERPTRSVDHQTSQSMSLRTDLGSGYPVASKDPQIAGGRWFICLGLSFIRSLDV